MTGDGDIIAWRGSRTPEAMTRSVHMRILVIEDDAETAAYVVAGLEAGGHAADVAPDGREGLVLATSDTYDVIVVDRMLPGFDGLVIVKRLREAGI